MRGHYPFAKIFMEREKYIYIIIGICFGIPKKILSLSRELIKLFETRPTFCATLSLIPIQVCCAIDFLCCTIFTYLESITAF